ncbi:unnamed protein product [Anisakis simplex]|uniref:Sas10 domain-containing protein n=1 Tax=Anisakis simplex TaxID=6269 RepID=A0A0M3KBH1_ANISI|nr:unnamed protein product [Anisakis simplex]
MAREREESEENSDEVYDEIDQFHRKRNEVLDLDEGKQSNKIEEVLNVEGDISSDEDEDFADGNSDADRDSLFDSSDNEQNKADTSKALPSADRWGHKRQAYYSTSYVDLDFGGMNEDEEELAELEREDAIERQKKLDAALEAVQFDDIMVPQTDKSTEVTKKKRSAVDLDSMSEAQKLEYFLKINPEFEKMIDEYKAKRELMQARLLPLLTILNVLKTTERRTVLEQQIRSAVSLFSSYLLNILFYMYLKTTTKMDGLQETKRYMDEHPVIDAIIAEKKQIGVVEQFLESNATALTRILKKVEKNENKSLSRLIEQCSTVDDIIGSKSRPSEASENLTPGSVEYSNVDGMDDKNELMNMEGYDEGHSEEGNEGHGGKRAITSQV